MLIVYGQKQQKKSLRMYTYLEANLQESLSD